MLKKSYTGFVLGLLVYVAALMSLALIPEVDEHSVMRLIMLMTVWYMAWLSFHIWRTEQIYWYNGTTYEDAVNAGSDRRKAFAWQHFRLFVFFALLQTLLSCAACLLGWSEWIDFTFGTVGTIVTACRTIPIKL